MISLGLHIKYLKYFPVMTQDKNLLRREVDSSQANQLPKDQSAFEKEPSSPLLISKDLHDQKPCFEIFSAVEYIRRNAHLNNPYDSIILHLTSQNNHFPSPYSILGNFPNIYRCRDWLDTNSSQLTYFSHERIKNFFLKGSKYSHSLLTTKLSCKPDDTLTRFDVGVLAFPSLNDKFVPPSKIQLLSFSPLIFQADLKVSNFKNDFLLQNPCSNKNHFPRRRELRFGFPRAARER